jgi:hypothetical protein
MMDVPHNPAGGLVSVVTGPSRRTPFATPASGSEYFDTEAHYLALAGRIVAALRRGSNFALLIGDPPANPVILSRALSNAAAWWYTVVSIACGPELNRDRLLRIPREHKAKQESVSRTDAAGLASCPLPLFIFDDAGSLSDEQLEHIYECLQPGDRITASAVLLVRPAFLIRLERSKLCLFNQAKTARLSLQELGREEIEIFIHRQLREESEIRAFTPEAIAAIAETSGGDPALVNSLARLRLEFIGASGYNRGTNRAVLPNAPEEPRGENPIKDNPSVGPRGLPELKTDEAFRKDNTRLSFAPLNLPVLLSERLSKRPLFTPRVAKPRYRRSAWGVGIGLLLCLSAGVFVFVPSDSLWSLARDLKQGIPISDMSDLATWTRRLRANFLSNSVDNVQLDTIERSMSRDPEIRESVHRGAEDKMGQEMGPPSAFSALASSPNSEAGGSSIDSPNGPPEELSEERPITGLTAAGVSPAPAVTANSSGPETPAYAKTFDSPLRDPALEPSKSELSGPEIAALVARGDFFVSVRDLASARLFYERAAEAGDGSAALRMGATFDPAFLNPAGIPTESGNLGEAASWYRRARDLGIVEAERRLKASNVQPN